MSYVTCSKEYEDKILEGMARSTACDCYVPAYGKANGLSFDPVLCETIEAAIMKSERHVGEEIHLLPTAFADYLFKQCHVSDVDCEFLVMMCHRLMARTVARVSKRSAKEITKKYSPYIDWKRYFADHPEFKKGDGDNADGTEVQ